MIPGRGLTAFILFAILAAAAGFVDSTGSGKSRRFYQGLSWRWKSWTVRIESFSDAVLQVLCSV